MIEPLRIVDHIADYTPDELERFIDASYLASGVLCPTAFGFDNDAVRENLRLAAEYERGEQCKGEYVTNKHGYQVWRTKQSE